MSRSLLKNVWIRVWGRESQARLQSKDRDKAPTPEYVNEGTHVDEVGSAKIDPLDIHQNR